MDIIKTIFDYPIPLILIGYLLFFLLLLWVDSEGKFKNDK